jgi:large subunit ribosomal protein L10
VGIAEDILGLEAYKGGIGIAYGQGEGVEASKILVKFAKTNEKLQVLGGYIGQAFFDKNQIRVLATLPSREELVAKLLYVLNSPMQRLVRALASPQQQLVTVLHQLANKK